MPGGNYSINRTVRLDGLQVKLRGREMQATAILGFDESWSFSEVHWIETEAFPGGAVPRIEIGYERLCGKHSLSAPFPCLP